jgi:eukaryotic-like serine/threonine-protein kinase
VNLQAGTRLGVYEILAPLGAGGMGEVYRARDTRIGREVAIKVLPQAVAEDRERLARFEREARAAGALNHPNLMTIYELGMEGTTPYLVSELMEGSTLRERLGGAALPPRKAIEYALQIAAGLGAAHDKGIVHRDLKPENIFVTRDGRVKILDFGLAKVREISREGTQVPTAPLETDPGTVVGTAGYMSPEQVRGERVDHRTDIFSLGAILYEMLSGKRAFHASSSIDTMHAILHADPASLSGVNAQISPSLERIVQHCLEKSPEERFQSARDLAFDLQTVSGASGSAASVALVSTRKLGKGLAIAAAILAAALLGWLAASRLRGTAIPHFRRLTFHSSTISGARFMPGQDSIVFSSVSGPTSDLFMVTPGRPEMRSLGMPNSILMSIARSGEMAILKNFRPIGGFIIVGTLARVPVGGGAPREIAESVEWAEWMPGSDDLLILRTPSGHSQIEMPIGNVICTAPGWISTPRPSSDGKTIAFIDHPIHGDDAGQVMILTSDHKKRALSRHFNSVQGLAWGPGDREIWFTATVIGSARGLWAVTLDGHERLLASSPGELTIQDVAPDGRVLIAQSNQRIAMFAHVPGEATDRDISWLDWSVARDLTPDGQQVLFDETAEGGGPAYSVYVRRVDGSPAIRLGDGVAQKFSADGRSALALRLTSPLPQVFLYPIGPGETRQLTNDGLTHNRVDWMPDGRHFVFIGHEPNHSNRLYIQAMNGGKPQPFTAEGVGRRTLLVSPDGTNVCTNDTDGKIAIFSLSGERRFVLPELGPSDVPITFTPDGKSLLYFQRIATMRPNVFKIDLQTHKIETWREIPAPIAPYGVQALLFSRDGKSYVYGAFLDSGDLYLLDDVK